MLSGAGRRRERAGRDSPAEGRPRSCCVREAGGGDWQDAGWEVREARGAGSQNATVGPVLVSHWLERHEQQLLAANHTLPGPQFPPWPRKEDQDDPSCYLSLVSLRDEGTLVQTA